MQDSFNGTLGKDRMKKLVFFPSDPISAYIKVGKSYDYIERYFNPGGYFDEVYCLSPWGDVKEETIGQIHYIKASPCKYAEIIKRLQPDVVRGYGGYCCADWISINKVEGIPTVVSVHDTNPRLIHDSLKYADGIICMSKAVEDAVKTLVPDVTSNIWIMPNRIDTELFKNKNDEVFFEKLNNQYGHTKHILHVGRKAEQKNIDTVIKSLRYVPDDVNCIFVGRGNTEQYKQLAVEEGVIHRCFFEESVPNSELPMWYSWADCMCTPSRWEGFGYVFIEAAACEAGIVTSNIAPMNEYLTDGLNSILVDDYENPEKIADAINRVLSNTDDIQQMKRAAREVGLKFKKEVIDKEEIAIYEKVMSCKPNNRNYTELRAQMRKKDIKKRIKAPLVAMKRAAYKFAKAAWTKSR